MKYNTIMNLYLIRAKVTKRVFGISGPFLSTDGRLVHANNLAEAKVKFEADVRRQAANMQCESINFEYVEIINEIK